MHVFSIINLKYAQLRSECAPVTPKSDSYELVNNTMKCKYFMNNNTMKCNNTLNNKTMKCNYTMNTNTMKCD